MTADEALSTCARGHRRYFIFAPLFTGNAVFADSVDTAYDQSIADYRKALSLDPDMKEAKDGLKRLGAAP